MQQKVEEMGRRRIIRRENKMFFLQHQSRKHMSTPEKNKKIQYTTVPYTLEGKKGKRLKQRQKKYQVKGRCLRSHAHTFDSGR